MLRRCTHRMYRCSRAYSSNFFFTLSQHRRQHQITFVQYQYRCGQTVERNGQFPLDPSRAHLLVGRLNDQHDVHICRDDILLHTCALTGTTPSNRRRSWQHAGHSLTVHGHDVAYCDVCTNVADTRFVVVLGVAQRAPATIDTNYSPLRCCRITRRHACFIRHSPPDATDIKAILHLDLRG